VEFRRLKWYILQVDLMTVRGEVCKKVREGRVQTLVRGKEAEEFPLIEERNKLWRGCNPLGTQTGQQVPKRGSVAKRVRGGEDLHVKTQGRTITSITFRLYMSQKGRRKERPYSTKDWA